MVGDRSDSGLFEAGSSSGDLNMGSRNPFLDDAAMEDSVLRSEGNSQTSLLHGSGEDSIMDGEYDESQGVSDYQGYYSKSGGRGHVGEESRDQNASTSQLLAPEPGHGFPSSTSMASNLITPSDIMSPTEFGRYPQVSTRTTSMQIGVTPAQGSSSGEQSAISVNSTNPFLSDQDFSPFGGYPASSFPLTLDEKEEDDYLHNPDPEEEARLDKERFKLDFKHMDRRSAGGFVGLLFLFFGGLALFVILPVLTFTDYGSSYVETVEILSLYVYPQLSAIRTSLIDPDTPATAMNHTSYRGEEWSLVFSDEFNAEGRTFFDGDDQFWTAPNFYYAATKDLEWYSPQQAITSNGTLQLRMDALKNHDLYYRSAMLQSWNKVCFTQGYLEISVNLPNYGYVTGLWPGLWTMGNLGRPGYMATTDGVWPYSYEACDAGITPNQSSADGISYLPGQRLSVCTCDDEDHPNQGTGRGAPEIDILEAEVDTNVLVGVASQSMQIAPFDIWYIPDYDFVEIYNSTITSMNTYCGGPYQQAVSAVSTLNTHWYEFGENAGYYQKYAVEIINDDETGYVRWFVGDDPTVTVLATALHPNGNIDWRRISKEPMSIILNLGISNNWAYIDWYSIFFPVTMSIDYVRLYQPVNNISVTCDPDDYPTYDYILDHMDAYSNSNYTSWEGAGYDTPKNILTGNCDSSVFSL